MSSTQHLPIITETDLHYLAVTARAADRNNNLWAEAVTTFRHLIAGFDALLPEAGAADAQAKLNRIAQLSTDSSAYAITRSAELVADLAFTAWAAFVVAHFETSH